MAYRMSTKLKNEMFNAIRTHLSKGAIYVYTGSQPASGDSAPTGTLLGISTVGAAAWTAVSSNTNGLTFAAAAAGVLSKTGAETWQFVGIADGTAGWFRFVTGVTLADDLALDAAEEHPRIDGRISTSGAELNLSSTNIVTGGTVTIDSMTITWPAGL